MVQLRASSKRRVISSSDNEESDGTVGSSATKAGTPTTSQRKNTNPKPVDNGSVSESSQREKAKSRPSPQKSVSKSKVGDQQTAKPTGKPIYSFFNSATQKLQSSQPQRVQEKLPSTEEGLEVILDDSDDGVPPEISKGEISSNSSTALALRKRKFKHTENFEVDNDLLAPASQKFRKASSGERARSLTVFNDDKRPWNEQFPPADLSELAVHKKKVADVKQWIESCLSGKRRRILVLKGGAGTGKTTTVALLAQALGIDLLEWKDASPADYGAEGYTSSGSRFEEFVSRAGKSHGLVLSSNLQETSKQVDSTSGSLGLSGSARPQMLLIEEFPNTFSRTSPPLQVFRSTLAQYLATTSAASSAPIVPIVMIISETLLSTNTAAADSFTAHRLLGPELMMHPYINVIEFNPVATTFLTKALELIVVKEARKSGRRRTPGPQVLRHLAETGDVRSAVSSLEFLCLRDDDGDTWSSKVSFTKTRQVKSEPAMTKSETEALKLIGNREKTLGIFHSVGKIIYNKRAAPIAGRYVEQPPSWLSQHRRSQIPETDVDALIDELGTDVPTYVAAIHENYPLSCSRPSSEATLDSLIGCIETISDADLLSLDRFSFGTRAFTGTSTDSLRQDEMCFQVAARGVLFSLPHPVQRPSAVDGKRGDQHRIFYPASLKLWRKKEEIEGTLDVLVSRLKSGSNESRQQSMSFRRDTVGVESWRRGDQTNASAADDQTRTIAMEAKAEMVLERLPFQAHILSKSTISSSSRDLQKRIAEITQISGMLGSEYHNEASDDDDDENAAAPDDADQWTTDSPDGTRGKKSVKEPKIPSAKPKTMFEGGGLAIPVETSVEKLVLEDDDIIDD